MANSQTPPKKKSASKIKPVRKPFTRGLPVSKPLVLRSFKFLAYALLFALFNLLLGTAFSFQDSLFLRILTNGLLVMACAALVYMDGLRAGDGDVAHAEIIYTRQQNGKSVPKSDLEKCYHPLKSIVTVLCGAGILLIVAVVYACCTTKQVYSLQPLPSWVSSYTGDENVTLALQYYSQTTPITLVDVLRPVIRICIYPYVNIVGTYDTDALLIVDRLSPLLIMLPFLAYIPGYLQGPRSRALVHGSIASHIKRKNRKERKERKARIEKKNELI